MRSKIISIITPLVFLFVASFAQDGTYKDTIFLKNDIKIPCKILNTSYSEISILFGDNAVTKINTDNIDHYQFADFKEFKKTKKAKFREFSNNTVFFEGFGNGLYSSINFDRILYRDGNFATSFRIGYSQYQTGGLVPMELNFLGMGKITGCYSEFGIGYSPLIGADYDMSIVSLRLGFRYQQPKGGLFFRAAFLPLYQFPNKDYRERVAINNGVYGNIENSSVTPNAEGRFLPWFGLSIGYTIQK